MSKSTNNTNKHLSLNIADYHIKPYNHIRPELSYWEGQTYLYTNKKIIERILEHRPYCINFLGDIFDSPPNNIETFIFNDLLQKIREIESGMYSGKDITINLINGNHELIPNIQTRTYYHNLTKDLLKSLYDVNVYSYHEVKSPNQEKPFLFCGHESINKLEHLTKKYSVIFSHFRSSDPENKAIYTDEIDTTILRTKADLIILGDIHHRLKYDNVVYTGSPICTSFTEKDRSIDSPSILLLNEDTLETQWLETIEDKYNKKVLSFNEADSQEYIFAEMEKARKDYNKNNTFFKVKIVNSKSFIHSLKLDRFKEYSIIEPTYTDMRQVNQDEKEIMDIVNQSNISNIGTELDFEAYVEENNTRKDLSAKVKSTLNVIKGGLFND